MSISMNGVTLNGGDRSVVLVHEIKYVWLCLVVLVNMSETPFFHSFFVNCTLYLLIMDHR